MMSRAIRAGFPRLLKPVRLLLAQMIGFLKTNTNIISQLGLYCQRRSMQTDAMQNNEENMLLIPCRFVGNPTKKKRIKKKQKNNGLTLNNDACKTNIQLFGFMYQRGKKNTNKIKAVSSTSGMQSFQHTLRCEEQNTAQIIQHQLPSLSETAQCMSSTR